MSKTVIQNFKEVGLRIDSAVISFIISNEVFDQLTDGPDQLLTGLTAIAVLLLYIIIYVQLKRAIEEGMLITIRHNTYWKLIIYDFLDFLFSASIYIIIQYFVFTLRSGFDSPGISLSEQLVAIYVVALIGFVALNSFKRLA